MKPRFLHRVSMSSAGPKSGDKADRPKLWSTRSASWLPFQEAAGDLVLLGDGSLVAALEVAPVDIALMSQEEVQGLIVRYWQGLRSIHFPLSVYMGTRRQEVAGYLQEVTGRLDKLAGAGGQQDGFFGMLLEEQCRLLATLLSEHLRSRYSLLVVSHNPSGGLKGVARSVVGGGGKAATRSQAMLEEARGDLDLKLKKVEDVLRQVGLKHQRCTGRRLAAELLRLARPELMAEDVATLEASLQAAPVVRGEVHEGGTCEMAFSPQG